MNKQKTIFPLLILSQAVLLNLPIPSTAQAKSDTGSPAVIQGKFTLHKFEEPIGVENYEIRWDGDSVVVKMDFKFTDRTTPVSLAATFRSAPDFTPQSFEIKGKTARSASIDEALSIDGGTVHFRTRDKQSELNVPKGAFFSIAGYAPLTMQMLLVRYWATHGSPAQLATLPEGNVKVEPRGQDTVRIRGKDEKLDRYTIEGLIWGRETLWFDLDRNLVAAITNDAEYDQFEAIRQGYESGLGEFVRRAANDRMSALAEISKGISGSRAATLAIVGGTLIDGTGAAPVPDAAVLIHNGRIVAVGPRAKVKIPRDARVVNAQSKTILPGLWDMHAHFEQAEWGPIYLAAGVTTVRDCGNEFEFITAVRDAIAQGRGLGPRLLLAGVVDGSGRHAADTPEHARDQTDRYHDAGFQQMKIYSWVKLEEVKVVAAEAHRLGMTVTGHVPEGLTAYQVIEAGQDQINHITYIADMMHEQFPADMSRNDRRKMTAAIDLDSPPAHKALAFLKEHRTVVDPTMAVQELFTASTAKPPSSFEPGVTKVAPELARQLTDVEPPNEVSELRERVFQKELAIVGALHRAGIPIVAGTDQAVPGHSLHREIELYVQAGLTPMEALQAATIAPARAMGLEKESGTLEKGKRGDLILVNGNPLEDIRNTRNVEYVVTGGTMYSSAELWQSVGFAP
jgi:imidazolonepropionase-like amidohydrolase